ncbi:hypothetical protein ABIB48_002609 [Arthrobacter sp. UYCu511]|uniref:PaeR7I family type II restriction endonuclease n=1 Tax=Arthrobacter sp. UYCu511 TaxID=3156337 RepID=UPI003397DADF
MVRDNAKTKGAGNDRGNRSGATSGKNLDGFVEIMADLIAEAKIEGLVTGTTKTQVNLPGYLRPSKDWDLVLSRQGELLAAIEFKSHVGPSFGNNFNNRAEEAMGSSLDLRTAVQHGVYGDGHRMPFLGWCILVEDAPKSRAETGIASLIRTFKPMEEFRGESYLGRYDIFCQRLMEQSFYTAASVIASPELEGLESGDYSDMSEATSFEAFIRRFWEHLATV